MFWGFLVTLQQFSVYLFTTILQQKQCPVSAFVLKNERNLQMLFTMWNEWCLNTSSIIFWWQFGCQGENKDWLWRCSRSERGFPEALAAHVHAHRWIVGTGVTGTAQKGCQTAQAGARADTISGIKHRLPAVLPAQPSLFPAPTFQEIMPAKEAFFCSSTATFLRLFPEQEFPWSKQGFLHFPALIFRLAGAEPFLWYGMPSAVPCS